MKSNTDTCTNTADTIGSNTNTTILTTLVITQAQNIYSENQAVSDTKMFFTITINHTLADVFEFVAVTILQPISAMMRDEKTCCD